MSAGRAPLSRHLGIMVASIVGGALTVGAVLTDRVVHAEQYGAVDVFLTSRAERRFPFPRREAPVGAAGLNAVAVAVSDDVLVRIAGPDGDDLFAPTGPALPDPPVGVEDGSLRTERLGDDSYRIVTTSTDWGATVQIARNLAEADATVAAIRVWLALGVIAVSAGAFGVGRWWSRRATRPLVDLAVAAERVTASGEIEPASIGRPDRSAPAEVERLATSIDDMLGALADSQERQRRLVADASHELRTPLAVVRTNAELLGSDRLSASDRDAARLLLIAEVDEMSQLADELVELAGDHRRSEPELDVDVRAVAEAVADRAVTRFGCDVTVEPGPTVRWRCQPGRLDRALWNLVDNAVKFSTDESPVGITVDHDRVDVRDRGIGVAPGEEQRIFERFHRSDEARGMRGSGLGLAIVAQIATDHDGEVVALRPVDGVGALLRFRVAEDRVLTDV